MPATPASLLERLRLPNSERHWDQFVELYTPLLFFWARRMGLGQEDAADLVQDVFVVLSRELPGFRYNKGQRFRGWLWTVTLNLCRQRRRSAAARPSLEAVSDLSEYPQEDWVPEFDEAEYRAYLVQRTLKLMQAEFSPPMWQACWETVMNAKPAADVAKDLGITVNAVYLAKSRVLRRLRTILDGLLD